MSIRFTGLAIATLGAVVVTSPAAPPMPEGCDLATKVAAADKKRDANIRELRSVRQYRLHNSRWEKDATMTAFVATEADGRKHYEILDIKAEGMQKTVLKRILDAEVEMSRDKGEDSSLSPENYEFAPLGYESCGGKQCLAVQLKPRRKSKVLIEGKAWFDVEDAAPLRVEGRPSKSVSFWVGRPYVAQEFRKVGDFWLSSKNQSVADVKLIGKTELTVQYLDYSVTPKSGAPLMACARSCSPKLLD
jgi:hypothetical protein